MLVKLKIRNKKKKKSPKELKKVPIVNPDKDTLTWKQVKLLPTLKIVPAKQVPRKVKIGQTSLPKSLVSLKKDFLNKLAGDYDNKRKYRLGDIVKFNNKFYLNLIFSYIFDATGKRIFLDSETKGSPDNDKAWKLVQIDEQPSVKEKFENVYDFNSIFKSAINLFNQIIN